MRFASIAACALLACATAGPSAGTARADRIALAIAGAQLVVVHDSIDPGTAARIVRSLPRAVPRAVRWGPIPSATIVVHGSERRFREAIGETGRGSLRAWTRYDVVHVRDPRTWGPIGAADDELDDVLAHELVHCAMYQAIADGASWERRPVPFWFREGMAMERRSAEEDRALRTRLRALEGRRAGEPGASVLSRATALVPEHPDLAYAMAYVAFRTFLGRYGEGAVGPLLTAMRRGGTFDEAFTAATRSPLTAFDAEVGRALRADPRSD